MGRRRSIPRNMKPTLTALLALCLCLAGCGREASSKVMPIYELVPHIKNEMEARYSKKGVSANTLFLYHDKGKKYEGTGEFTWKDEKYKFTMDVTMVDGSYNWIATPLTGNQELIKIFKYSTN